MLFVLFIILVAVIGTMVYLHFKHNATELALEVKLKDLEEKVLEFFKNLGHH